MNITTAGACAARNAASPLSRINIKRRETQEMLDFCAAHGIASDVEMIPIQRINDAWERLLRQDVRYRFVIDMESLR
jgi:D-arabinose 1-dehydrogenase-like Zn-dependent alcohol dehydrogenase